jgi:GNAT superfamily N-acetyltransferase
VLADQAAQRAGIGRSIRDADAADLQFALVTRGIPLIRMLSARESSMTEVTIRKARASDEARWRVLWAGYVAFYRASVSEDVTANSWRQILDPASNIHALVAEKDGVVIGICNYVFHDSTWSTQPICYLQDLFVDPAMRGGGAAKKLILACEEEAKAKGAFRLYWQTQEYNAPARSLYDTITPRSSFIVYRKNI